EGTELNLIPTSKILYFDSIFMGLISYGKLQVALGDSFKGMFDPDKLVDELARVDVTEIQFIPKNQNGDSVYTLKTKVSMQWKEKIKEVGLYFKEEHKDNWVLIAYYSQEDFLYDTEILILTLVLLHKGDNYDPDSKNNPEPINTIQPPLLMSSPYLGNSPKALSST